VAIFVGAVGACIGLFTNQHSALIVGVIVCVLGVLEFTVREHFSGYRSHAMLLAAVPPVAILITAVTVLGAPRERTTRELLVVATIPVFAVGFWALRKRFRTARQARIVRPPAA
jgi:ABC-type proline/glycine betaine transport system permease subunit